MKNLTVILMGFLFSIGISHSAPKTQSCQKGQKQYSCKKIKNATQNNICLKEKPNKRALSKMCSKKVSSKYKKAKATKSDAIKLKKEKTAKKKMKKNKKSKKVKKVKI